MTETPEPQEQPAAAPAPTPAPASNPVLQVKPVNPLVKPDVSLEDKQEVDPRLGLPESVNVVEGQAPMQLQPEKADATGPWIHYTGVATVRIMDAEAWKQAGVDSTKYCEWNYLNKKRLPRKMFNDRELQYLLRVDGRFELVDN